MIKYTVKYREKGFFKRWKKLKNIIGDEFVQTSSENYRAFHLEDKSIILIPSNGTKFILSKERFFSIKQAKEKEIGQPIKTV